MDGKLLSALAFLGVQGMCAGLAFVALCTPLTRRFARRIHRRRVLVMLLGLLAALWPLWYFAQRVDADAGFYNLKYVVFSFIIAVVQVALYVREDKRRIERNYDTQMPK